MYLPTAYHWDPVFSCFSKVQDGISCLQSYINECLEDGSIKISTSGVIKGLENIMKICNTSDAEKGTYKYQVKIAVIKCLFPAIKSWSMSKFW